jgi:hypothetical protein
MRQVNDGNVACARRTALRLIERQVYDFANSPYRLLRNKTSNPLFLKETPAPAKRGLRSSEVHDLGKQSFNILV